MTDKQIKEVFTNYCYILIDKREKMLHIKNKFEELGTHFRMQNLNYGDYGIVIIPNPIIGNEEEILMKVSVERKNGLDELAMNLTSDNKRFYREMERCLKDKGTMVIMIENCTYNDIVEHNYRSELKPKAFLGLLHSLTAKYGVQFIFIPRDTSSLFVYNFLKYYTRNILKKIDK